MRAIIFVRLTQPARVAEGGTVHRWDAVHVALAAITSLTPSKTGNGTKTCVGLGADYVEVRESIDEVFAAMRQAVKEANS